MSYTDLDIIFLNHLPDLYLGEYVPAAVWQDEGASLEITNSAFCLSKPVLEHMMTWSLARIKQTDRKWFYTELGPSMFGFVVLNHWKILIISQNHPLEGFMPAIIRQIKSYGHQQLHVTTSIRMRMHHKFKMDYMDIFESLRQQLGLVKLKVV